MNTITFEFSVGEIVFDDITKKKVEIIGISYHNGRKYNEKRR